MTSLQRSITKKKEINLNISKFKPYTLLQFENKNSSLLNLLELKITILISLSYMNLHHRLIDLLLLNTFFFRSHLIHLHS